MYPVFAVKNLCRLDPRVVYIWWFTVYFRFKSAKRNFSLFFGCSFSRANTQPNETVPPRWYRPPVVAVLVLLPGWQRFRGWAKTKRQRDAFPLRSVIQTLPDVPPPVVLPPLLSPWRSGQRGKPRRTCCGEHVVTLAANAHTHTHIHASRRKITFT